MTDETATPAPWPARAYARMAILLRLGLVGAGLTLGVALVLFVGKHPVETLPQTLTQNPILDYLSASGLMLGFLNGHTEALMTLGVLVLVATPLARVALGGYYFHRNHDPPLTRIAVFVFVLLAVGIFVLGPILR